MCEIRVWVPASRQPPASVLELVSFSRDPGVLSCRAVNLVCPPSPETGVLSRKEGEGGSAPSFFFS